MFDTGHRPTCLQCLVGHVCCVYAFQRGKMYGNISRGVSSIKFKRLYKSAAGALAFASGYKSTHFEKVACFLRAIRCFSGGRVIVLINACSCHLDFTQHLQGQNHVMLTSAFLVSLRSLTYETSATCYHCGRLEIIPLDFMVCFCTLLQFRRYRYIISLIAIPLSVILFKMNT